MSEFHARCDGHPNTLTLVRDTRGNIFGGFTPTAWESDPLHNLADPTGWTFIFTSVNPRKAPPKKWQLVPAQKQDAIRCADGRGPSFGGGAELSLADICTEPWNYGSYDEGSFGPAEPGYKKIEYWADFFTGGAHFTVAEIKVFEVGE
jgi:hypothetical protein